ncbi:LURP-one-related family protein [Deinococcus sp.]|uniref:LURP-one-related family protein n=1 Tax=Deinococcus sp. TaxID=47478 RepID=UPI0025EA11C7|nr:LURP-one-related family protein [Deinococcus sp.]
MTHKYPLKATFRFITLSPEVQVKDADERLLMQVKQKLLTLREDTTIYGDEAKTQPLYRMKANQIIGFRAVHTITRIKDETVVGGLRAAGLRSIWRASYDITDASGNTLLHIQEGNPWVKVLDGLLDEIPLIGPLIAMFINPYYTVRTPGGADVFRILKKRSFVARHFLLERLGDSPEGVSEDLAAITLVEVAMLERNRQ